MAFVRENGLRFLTGCVLFRPHHETPREAQNYGSVVLVEEWVRGQDEALGRLSRLISGQETIGGQKIGATFSRTDGQHQTYAGIHGWLGWQFVSHLDRPADRQDFHLPQTPLLAHGLRPYLGAAEAVSQWLFEKGTTNQMDARVEYQDRLVTVLPDTRARLISAEWLPGRLRLEIDLGVQEDQVQLQLLYVDASRQTDLLMIPQGPAEFEVPDDVREIHVFLVHTNHDCIAQLPLSSLYHKPMLIWPLGRPTGWNSSRL